MFGLKSKVILEQKDENSLFYEKTILDAIDVKFNALVNLDETLSIDELELSKFLLQGRMISNLQKQFDRIEEEVKQHVYFNKDLYCQPGYFDQMRTPELIEKADKVLAVKIEDVKRVLKRILDSQLGIFHLGLFNTRLPSKLSI